MPWLHLITERVPYAELPEHFDCSTVSQAVDLAGTSFQIGGCGFATLNVFAGISDKPAPAEPPGRFSSRHVFVPEGNEDHKKYPRFSPDPPEDCLSADELRERGDDIAQAREDLDARMDFADRQIEITEALLNSAESSRNKAMGLIAADTVRQVSEIAIDIAKYYKPTSEVAKILDAAQSAVRTLTISPNYSGDAATIFSEFMGSFENSYAKEFGKGAGIIADVNLAIYEAFEDGRIDGGFEELGKANRAIQNLEEEIAFQRDAVRQFEERHADLVEALAEEDICDSPAKGPILRLSDALEGYFGPLAGAGENDLPAVNSEFGSKSADRFKAGGGGDFVSSGAGDDRIAAKGGGDMVLGGRGADVVKGGAGSDTFIGEGGSDALRGQAGRDVLLGGKGRDRLVGGAGADELAGDGGADVLKGAKGADTLAGGRGNDIFGGSNGRDVMEGGWGRDRLKGGGGDDIVIGGRGPDRLSGGAGDDRLDGGAGGDTFVFRSGSDVIVDFAPGRDALDLTGADGVGRWGDLREMGQERGNKLVLDLEDGHLTLSGLDWTDLAASDVLL